MTRRTLLKKTLASSASSPSQNLDSVADGRFVREIVARSCSKKNNYLVTLA